MQTFNIIAFFRMKKVLVYNLDALLRTVIHCLITNAFIAFFILIYSGTSHFHLFFTSTLCVDLIVLQILKDINVKHYSREKGLKMGPDNITVWNPIEQVLREFFQLKFIQVVFWHIAIKKKWYKRQKISLLIINIFRLLNTMIYWSRWSVDLR